MLITDDSPLRRLPSNLSALQAQFCDALRFTAEMTDFAYEQLSASLLRVSGLDPDLVRVSAVEPFLCAWSVIDSAHRLRGLVQTFPNLAKKNQSPEFRTFSDKAEKVETLRHAVQHMDRTIRESAEPGNAAWGVLTWLSPTPRGTIYSGLLVSGAMMPGGECRPIIPAGMTVKAPVDHITLTAVNVSVNLTDVMAALVRLVGVLENGLSEAFEAFPNRAGSDMLIGLEGYVGPNNTWIVVPGQDSARRARGA